MNKTFKTICIMAMTVCLALPAFAGCKGGNGGKKVIRIDGGGDIGTFNTTADMTVSPSNPYPYNTLEKLCEEWEKEHPEYDVQIARTSNGGDQQTLTALLSVPGNAPEILYQNGGVVNSQLGLDYYVPLNSYLNEKNPYDPEREKWIDLYDISEFTTAADGERYYINLERHPIGILYNKDLLTKIGLTEADLTTFTGFLNAQKTLQEYNAKNGTDYNTYLTSYRWYDLQLESNIFGSLVPEFDTLIKDNRVDTEELIRGYKKGIWGVGQSYTDENGKTQIADDGRFELYLAMLKLRTKYYPKNFASLDALSSFVTGKCLFIEGTGGTMRQVNANNSVDFELGVVGYPTLSIDDLNNFEETKGYVTKLGLKEEDISNCRRGSAGYATAWFVSNSAVENDVVDGCIDLLKYLTAPAQNNRLIGDLGGGIPLNPDDDTEIKPYLTSLLDMYYEDCKDESLMKWGAFSHWSVLTLDYNGYFLVDTLSYINGTITLESLKSHLKGQIATNVTQFINENDYDQSKW